MASAICSDEESQMNEIDSLESIYDNDLKVFVDEKGKRCITMRLQTDSLVAIVEIAIPLDYPSNLSPILTFVSCDCLNSLEKNELIENCESMFVKNEVIIYEWIEKIKECLNEKCTILSFKTDTSETEKLSFPSVEEPALTTQQTLPTLSTKQNDDVLKLTESMCHGEPFTDRRSTFQAHIAIVHSLEELETNLRQLKANRKIAVATHNILAYRFFDSSKNVLVQDCDDDGESAAGGRLLHLLQIMDVTNAVVVVSRWYGGIQLGPDRFKHINNVARTLLISSGIVENKSEKKKGKQRKR